MAITTTKIHFFLLNCKFNQNVNKNTIALLNDCKFAVNSNYKLLALKKRITLCDSFSVLK